MQGTQEVCVLFFQLLRKSNSEVESLLEHEKTKVGGGTSEAEQIWQVGR